MQQDGLDGLVQRISARLSRRTSLDLLAGASISFLGLAEATNAKKTNKITLCGNGGSCFAFVTAATFTGSTLQGLAGADATCQSAASAVGLPGTYMAWLSANRSTPTNRFTNTSNAGPYVRILAPANGGGPGVGPVIANSFAELLACAGGNCLANTISDTEKGQPAPDIPVWTGTRSDGTAAAETCLGWTSDAVFRLAGDHDRVNAQWTDIGTSPCNEARPVYCFQQAT